MQPYKLDYTGEEVNSAIGDVLNGQVSGGTQSDYAQNDATQPDYIKNRPGGYYQIVPGVDITWDGVIGDRPKVELDEGMYLVKVSDEVLTAEQMIGATLTVTQGEQQQSSVLNDENVQAGDGYVNCDGLISFSKTTVSVGRQTLTVPETGTYFIYGEQSSGVAYVSALQKSDSQVLVPIPGELTNIKGGYDLLAINNQPVYSGTVPASAFSIATQAAQGGEIAVQSAAATKYSAPLR